MGAHGDYQIDCGGVQSSLLKGTSLAGCFGLVRVGFHTKRRVLRRYRGLNSALIFYFEMQMACGFDLRLVRQILGR